MPGARKFYGCPGRASFLLIPSGKYSVELMCAAHKSFVKYNTVMTTFLGVFTAVASNRPTEALASVISLAFVVYST